MRLRQACWVCWVVGTGLIVLSWIDVVSPPVGWGGFVLSLIGAAISYFPQAEDRNALPLTQEGLPVEPSGSVVPPDMDLEPGTPLLAFSRGKWWRATVIFIEPDGRVLVCFPGWDASRRESLPRYHLQIDPDPSRIPLRLPPQGWVGRGTSDNRRGGSSDKIEPE